MKTAYVFSSDGSIEEMADAMLVESKVLRGFALDCRPIWLEELYL